MPTQATELTARFTEAAEYARQAHAGQVRKQTRIPYISHPIAVASLVLSYGGDEDEAIAALLHDVLEDCGAHHEAAIRERFGDRVARIVLDCTDGTAEAKSAATTLEEKRENWRRRKESYLAALKRKRSDTILVSACDKLHNARCIVDDLEHPATGMAVFDRFVAGREGTIWYYNELVRAFEAYGSPVTSALALAVEKIAAANATPHWRHGCPPGRDSAMISSRRGMAIVLGSDGFWAIRVDGRWTRSPPFKFTFRDWEDFAPVDEAATMIEEARAAASLEGEQLWFAGLPESFEPGTEFAEWEDIPLSKSPGWVVLAWDKSEPRRIARWLDAYALNEGQFRARVSLLHCGTDG